MPLFKDDQIIIIAPGSQTTLAQMGLPESFTPAKMRLRTCMFPGPNDTWEPYSVRQKSAFKPPSATNGVSTGAIDASNPEGEKPEEAQFEEDRESLEGAVWPIQEGHIVNWPCFLAFLTHVCNSINLNAVFYTPILLLAQPAWTSTDHERISEFLFEKLKVPALCIMDSAMATLYAYSAENACIIDVGKGKADVTAISGFMPYDICRGRALRDCGGDAMTQHLADLLGPKKFTWDMCEQLKKSSICEILPEGIPLPASGEVAPVSGNPASAASTGAFDSGPGARMSSGAIGEQPRGPGENTDVGEERERDEEAGVLDVASLVTGGKMDEYLARKDKEKAEKAAKRKGGTSKADDLAQQKQQRLPNAKREKATFMFEDHALLNAIKESSMDEQQMAAARSVLDEANPSATEANGGATAQSTPRKHRGTIRREVEVGTERFQATSDGIIERIADAAHKAIMAVPDTNRRSAMWDCIILVGNGAKVRGFKDALMTTLQARSQVAPSTGTMFTSELPSNISTPAGTGANTPQPQLGPHGSSLTSSSSANPLLVAATTAQNPHLNPMAPGGMHMPAHLHSSHHQSPTSIKYGRVPEYFPEWKDVGYDEATFLGAQVAAKVVFINDTNTNKSYMTRTDFNDMGPQGIREFAL